MGRVLWVLLVVMTGFGIAVQSVRQDRGYALPEFTPAREETTVTEGTEASAPRSLPCTLENGTLVAEELVEYEGPYLEDGSGEPVAGIAALMLHNTGNRGISSCAVAIQQGGRTLYFCATWIPAGARVLVLSCDRSVFSRAPVTDCRCIAVRWEDFYSAGPGVQVSQSPDGQLTVTNDTYEDLQRLCLRWKPYIQDGDFYLGGISRSIYIGTLSAGQTALIPREHASMDIANVVAILSHS